MILKIGLANLKIDFHLNTGDELGISIKREDFSDYEALTNIMKVTNCNFRLIHRLFTQIERILEINHLTSITTEAVEAARNSLVIGRK
jgi:DNA transposition AAA+ family ATPase